ncbi:zinc finger protein 395a [Thalassophryne amazonica]|uniref:zinc finger protein 395a n=1 Tax=Thalassophryne amazonica TaxID=390379 RepID=UPI001470EE6E|nr:zinc finger protein 395a [Thalassophryne amazonica]
MLPKTRLGKRSPLGALVSSTLPAATGTHTDQEMGETNVAAATAAARQQTVGGVHLQPGLKMYFQFGGRENPALAERMDIIQSQAPGVRKTEEPASHHSSSVPTSSRSISSSIDVPRRSQRSPEEVEMDEMMAAMVLTTLSCSPQLHSPAQRDPTAPPMDCGGSELSDSSSSGYWSVGHSHGSPAPSPPSAESETFVATSTDEGLEIDLEQMLFDEPAPRKRRNSVKTAYHCLWPSCEKVLTSVVGIKRHIRTTHLSCSGEQERCSHSEEDFYYTEINQQSPATQLHGGPAPASPTATPSSPSSPPRAPPPSPPSPPPATSACGTLSRSLPCTGTFWQVQSEHSYQAPLPNPALPTGASCMMPGHWMAPPTGCHNKQGLPIRVRSVSVGEQWLQHHSTPCRRVRGEAKKCRKVYGIEHRDQWCTACRWKKACQRFLD